MPWARARLESGAEVTANADYLSTIEGIELLDVDPLDHRGRPLAATRKGGRPAKRRTTVKKAAAKKTAAKKQTESSPVTTSGGVAAESPKEASK